LSSRRGYTARRSRLLEFQVAAAASGQDHAAFGGGEAAPDAVGLGLKQCVFAALDHDRTAGAHALGGVLAGESGGGGFLGGCEEQACLVAPAHRFGVPWSVLVPVSRRHPLSRNSSYLQGRMRRLQHGLLLTTASRARDDAARPTRCARAYALSSEPLVFGRFCAMSGPDRRGPITSTCVPIHNRQRSRCLRKPLSTLR
jgi:hypothetical protein